MEAAGAGSRAGAASPILIRTSSQPSHLECVGDREAAPGPQPRADLQDGPPLWPVSGGWGGRDPRLQVLAGKAWIPNFWDVQHVSSGSL